MNPKLIVSSLNYCLVNNLVKINNLIIYGDKILDFIRKNVAEILNFRCINDE